MNPPKGYKIPSEKIIDRLINEKIFAVCIDWGDSEDTIIEENLIYPDAYDTCRNENYEEYEYRHGVVECYYVAASIKGISDCFRRLNRSEKK